MSSRTFKVSFY